MGSFEFIEHTADKGFRVRADDLEDLFETSVQGLAQLLREDISPDAEVVPVSESIKIESEDITALLVDFLSQVLTLSHIHNTVFTQVDVKEITSSNIEADIYGSRVNYFDEVIKAVTYHQADVRKTNNGEQFITNIIFDI